MIAYRDEGGRARVLHGLCPHMGVDLRHGCIEGNAVRCALHGRRFGADGACDNGPGTIAYDTEERWGIVWCRVGTPDPERTELAAEPTGRRLTFPARHTPAHIHFVTGNQFDREHFEVLHEADLLDDPVPTENGVRMRIQVRGPVRAILPGAFEVEFTAYGCNTTHLAIGAPLHFEFLMSGRPSTQGGSFIYPSIAPRGGPLATLRAMAFARAISSQDEVVLGDAVFHPGFGPRDELLRRFAERVDGMPAWERRPDVGQAPRGAHRRRPEGLPM